MKVDHVMTTPDPLVSTDWLAAHLQDPKLRLIDATYKMPAMRPPSAFEDYSASHLPGAAFFDVDSISDRANPLPHMIPSPEEFARHAAALGIDDDSSLVIYDAGNYMGGPRAWWMFRLYGFANVRLLDGGLKKWLAEGRPVESGAVAPRAGNLTSRFEAGRVRRREQLVANLDSKAEQVVDARARDRYEGRVAEPWPGRRSGRIPGSLNVPFNTLINPDATMKSPEQLREIFQAASVDLSKPIVTSCGSGVTAATVTLALARIGIDNTSLYDGSWAEWGLPDGPPVATGPA
jgi:thiosulfate/3-mercaptopyruvate sulfurtransferase